MEPIRMTKDEYIAEGERRFGSDRMEWAWVCPVCKHVQTARDYKEAGAPEGAVAFSCVGRWLGAGSGFTGHNAPCDYAGGGLFGLNPLYVTDDNDKEHHLFEFAPAREGQETKP